MVKKRRDTAPSVTGSMPMSTKITFTPIWRN